MDAHLFEALLKKKLRPYLSLKPKPQKSGIKLKLKDHNFNDKNLETLLRYCLKKGLSLSTLELYAPLHREESADRITDRGWKLLFKALKAPAFQNLHELDIRHEQIGDKAIARLGQTLRERGEGSANIKLDLSFCELSESAWVGLLHDLHVHELRAWKMLSTDGTVQAIADYIERNQAGYSLSLGCMNLSDPRHVERLAAGIKRGKRGRMTLLGCKIKDPSPLIDAWAATGLDCLELESNKLNKHDNYDWVARLPEIEGLTRICLRDNNLGDDFAKAFGVALADMPKVKAIELEGNSFTSVGLVHLFEGLSGRLQELTLKRVTYLDNEVSLDNEATLALAKYLVRYYRTIKGGQMLFNAVLDCKDDPRLAQLTRKLLRCVCASEDDDYAYSSTHSELSQYKKHYFRLKQHLATYDAHYAVTEEEMAAWDTDKDNVAPWRDNSDTDWVYASLSEVDYDYSYDQLQKDAACSEDSDSFSDTSDEGSVSALETLFSDSSSDSDSEQAVRATAKRSASDLSDNEQGFFRARKLGRNGDGDVTTHRAADAVAEVTEDAERDAVNQL